MDLDELQRAVVSCERCPRLREHCTKIAEVKRRAYLGETYWGKPVPSFGDPRAKLLIVGLAPGAHGANRTGRMFTGDRSGDFLYRALFETGFASQASSLYSGDGLELHEAWITASGHCAPPDNKPLPSEIAACRPFLHAELDSLSNLRVVVALGRIAFDNYLATLAERGIGLRRSALPFGHGTEHSISQGAPVLIASYHPSQQNTSTGRLTAEMLRDVFRRARELVDTLPA